MESFYVSCVMGYFYHTLCASIFFFSFVMSMGVFLFCSYSEAYSINDVVSQPTNSFIYLLLFLAHSICIYYRVWGESETELNHEKSTYSANTAFCYVQSRLYDRTVQYMEHYYILFFYGEHTIRPS